MIWQYVGLLATHWVADFILQSHWQAQNKSKSNDALARHVLTYTLALAGGSILIFGPSMRLFWFVALNGLLHFATDYFTSRWSARLYAKQDWHNFFAVIGLDQLVHQITMAVTMFWLLSV